MILSRLLSYLLFCLLHSHLVTSFEDYLLKRCDQSGFCNRNREYAKNIDKSSRQYYSFVENSIHYSDTNDVLYGTIVKTISRKESEDIVVDLPFTLNLLQAGSSLRFTINEERQHQDDIPEFLSGERFNETYKWAFDTNALSSADCGMVKKGYSWFHPDKLTFSNKLGDLKIEIFEKSFLLKVYYNNELTLLINDRSFLNIEHLRKKEENFKNILPEESSFNMFKDDFQYSKEDTMPFGPESVALDFTFKNYESVYGIPEHADSLRLRDTSGREPYRLYNVDVFEYNVGSTSPMYGAIPFMLATSPCSSAGLFWVNAADTWIDIKYDEKDSKTHWMSESGMIDVVLFFGSTPSEILQKYTEISGKPMLPPLASIGYHQCRWNYNDELDVLTVDSELDRAHIPYDYIWLDIEYTDEKKFFTWKPNAFPYPERLMERLRRLGRKLVILIDPHLKAGYETSEKVAEKNAAVKNAHGETFYGECWPGTSLWIDTFSVGAQKLWSTFLKTMVKATNLDIWNDMNEPSIFSGPETTAPKDLVHEGGYEERSVHNLYGLTVHQSTYVSMKEILANEDLRPFVLTRSFFAGSQRTTATWTGDNVANWEYLKISIPMCLSSNIAGMPFIGADIAGFSGDPEDELIVRWYQAGVWYPFFRAHAHIDSKRREPYLFKEPIKSLVRDTIQLRYSLLPTLYTTFYETSVSGNPIMSPMFFAHPEFSQLYEIEDQFYIGKSGIIVKPILEKGTTETEMLLAPGLYYDYYTLAPFSIEGYEPKRHLMFADLDKIPILLEGGNIITKRGKYRRSSKLHLNDPFTLVVAPDKHGNAFGELYLDDGATFAYQKGNFLKSEMHLMNGRYLTGNLRHSASEDTYIGNTVIEKIVIALGENSVQIGDTVEVLQGSESHAVAVMRDSPNTAMILNPSVRFDEPWKILF